MTYKRAIDAIKTNKSYYSAAASDYFEEILKNLNQFCPDREADPYDNEVVKFIDAFKPYRNEIIDLVEALAKYAFDKSYLETIKKFLEDFYPFTVRDEKTSSFRDWDWDVYKFIYHEIFLYIIAVLIKRKKFEEASSLINGGYYIKNANEAAKLVDVSIFRNHLKSLQHRNNRLELRRISLHADILKERCSGVSISFNELMQADFVLYLARYIHVKDNYWMPWFPVTLIYASYDQTGFEVFIRGETSAGMRNLQTLLGIPNKQPITDFLDRIKNKEADPPKFDSFRSINVSQLLNYEKLGTHK